MRNDEIDLQTNENIDCMNSLRNVLFDILMLYNDILNIM